MVLSYLVAVRQSFFVAYLISGFEEARLNPCQLFTEIVETAYAIRDLYDWVLGDSAKSL